MVDMNVVSVKEEKLKSTKSSININANNVNNNNIDDSDRLSLQLYDQNSKDKTLKKKWANPFKSKTKAHKTDFTRIFQTENSKESYLRSYKCCHLLDDDRLIQGRIYITRNSVCFYGKVFNEELNLTIGFTDIESIRKERKVKATPFATSITLASGSQLFEFSNFKSIEKVYKLLEKRSKSKSVINSSVKNQSVSSDSGSNIVEINDEIKQNQNPVIFALEDVKNDEKSPELQKNKSFVNEPVMRSSTPNTPVKQESNLQTSKSFVNGAKDVTNNQSLQNENEKAEAFDQQSNESRCISVASNNSSVDLHDEESTKKAKILTMNSAFEEASKEYVNCEFPVSLDKLVHILFENFEFFETFWKARKFYDISVSEWKMVDGYRSRNLQYCINGMIGSIQCKTVAFEKMVKYDLNSEVIAEAESSNHGIPYADAFSVLSRFRLLKNGENSTKLIVRSFINWHYKPNFIMKAFIDKNCNNAMLDNFKALIKRINEEIEKNYKKPLQKINSVKTNSSSPCIDTTDTKSITNKEETKECIVKQEIFEEPIKNTNDSLNNDFICQNVNMLTTQNFSNINNKAQLKMKKSKTNICLESLQCLLENCETNIKHLYRFIIILMICMIFMNFYLIAKFDKLENVTNKLRDDIDHCRTRCLNEGVLYGEK